VELPFTPKTTYRAAVLGMIEIASMLRVRPEIQRYPNILATINPDSQP
jgi:hypothetical protein